MPTEHEHIPGECPDGAAQLSATRWTGVCAIASIFGYVVASIWADGLAQPLATLAAVAIGALAAGVPGFKAHQSSKS